MLGEPGSGKSTTAFYLAWSHAKANSTATDAISFSKELDLLTGRPVPLLIELRLFSEIRKQRTDCSFLTYTTEVMLRREDLMISIQVFKELLKRRAMLVLFDGLDEVPTLHERRQLVDEIESFVQRYPGNRILVTSRSVGYELATFTNRLFHQAQIRKFR